MIDVLLREPVLPARARCETRLGTGFGLRAPGFWGCFRAGLVLGESVAGRKTGLIGSTAGGCASLYGRGVDPEGVGVHLVPLPVRYRGTP
jgi:hypothetical protein